MPFDRDEAIETLKRELCILEQGGYAPSECEPHWAPKIFRDSVSCPNLGLEIKVAPCSSCYLMEFVPPQYRNRDDACQHIPLNTQGETVASLSKAGDPGRLQSALRTWLQKTISRLAEGAEPLMLLEGGPNHPLLSAGGPPCHLLR
jgi:hypothetical protein